MTPTTADVRRFLIDYFSDEELTALCFDYFPGVYDGFTSGTSKGQKIQALMEYSRRREQLAEVLKVLQQERPAQFAARFEQAASSATAPAAPSPAVNVPTTFNANISGGMQVDADKITVSNDVGEGDKTVQNTATMNIDHATFIQPGTTIQDSKPTAPAATDSFCIIGGMEFVRVPAGKFIMGSKPGFLRAILESGDEKPQHTVEIPYDYWIGKYPVTNDQFAQFVSAAKYSFDQGDWKQKANHPVVKVSWRDALAYCQWLNATLHGELRNLVARLPTEAEWEKAARGTDGRTFPWGNDFNKNKCNVNTGGTTPVGAYSPWGDSPYSAADMTGNVWEWCHSIYAPYPYQANDGRENEAGDDRRVLRGGTFDYFQRPARCACRHDLLPDSRRGGIGFRVVVSPGSRG